MRTRLIIWKQGGKIFAHITREKVFETTDAPIADAEVVYLAVTDTAENDEKTLRRMAVMELTRPTPTRIEWWHSGEIWKF